MSFKPLVTGEDEQEHRQWLAYQFEQVSIGKAKTGVLEGMAVAATAPAASGSVVVAAGAGVCQPTTAGGVFPLVVPANETLDVFTSDPMQFVNNPRHDIVVVDQVTGLVDVLVGVSNAIPDDPAIPTTVLPLARLRHDANATTIPNTAIDDLRVPVAQAGGARRIVADAAARDLLVKEIGLEVYRLDLKRTETWDGVGWFTRVSGFGSVISTNPSGDFSFDTGLSVVKVWIPYNGNGRPVSPGKANITYARNADTYVGGLVTGRVFAADTGAVVASAATVTTDWMAEGYA